jgi:hypothetical protein
MVPKWRPGGALTLPRHPCSAKRASPKSTLGYCYPRTKCGTLPFYPPSVAPTSTTCYRGYIEDACDKDFCSSAYIWKFLTFYAAVVWC